MHSAPQFFDDNRCWWVRFDVRGYHQDEVHHDIHENMLKISCRKHHHSKHRLEEHDAASTLTQVVSIPRGVDVGYIQRKDEDGYIVFKAYKSNSPLPPDDNKSLNMIEDAPPRPSYSQGRKSAPAAVHNPYQTQYVNNYQAASEPAMCSNMDRMSMRSEDRPDPTLHAQQNRPMSATHVQSDMMRTSQMPSSYQNSRKSMGSSRHSEPPQGEDVSLVDNDSYHPSMINQGGSQSVTPSHRSSQQRPYQPPPQRHSYQTSPAALGRDPSRGPSASYHTAPAPSTHGSSVRQPPSRSAQSSFGPHGGAQQRNQSFYGSSQGSTVRDYNRMN